MPSRTADDQPELPLFESDEKGDEFDAGEPGTAPEPAAEKSEGSTCTADDGEIRRVFLGETRPLLETAVEHLAGAPGSDEPLDLSDHLVVVPTRNAGRRLREALAIRAAEDDSAVFPPRVVTPDFLFAGDRVAQDRVAAAAEEVEPVATPQQTLWTWAGVLAALPLGEFRRVFPIDPVERSLRWACDTAADFLHVRRLLAESGHTLASAAVRLAEEEMEPGRWAELAAIEERAIAELSRLGLRDEALVQLQTPNSGMLPDSIRRVLVCGVPDLRPLAGEALRRYATLVPVEILIAADSEHAGRFDAFGRPLPAQWLDRELAISEPERHIHRAVTPLDQAQLAVGRIVDLEDPAASSAIGIPDPQLSIPLREVLAEKGLETFDPAGAPLAGEGVTALLRQTGELVATESFAAFRGLLNAPGFADAILREIESEEKSSATRLVRLADDLLVHCLPDRLADASESAKRYPFADKQELRRAIEWARHRVALFRRASEPDQFGQVLADYLTDLHRTRRYTNRDRGLAVLTEVAGAVDAMTADLRRIEKAFPRTPDAEDRFELLLGALAGHRVYPEREPRDVDLQGWLELLWEDAPRLVVSGMNDHVVPEAIVGHAFLPDSARRVLGVPDNDDRFARDAYFLSAVLASRSGADQSVDLVFGCENASGDPLRPSRLLFQCPDEELPRRTLQLFRDVELDDRPEARSVAFPLRPRPLESDARVFHRLSPTSIKQYLACPFRFYLKFGLGMSSVEIDKREMDAADFGNLVHDSLEAFARDEEARLLSDAGKIRHYLHEEIDRRLARQFGASLSTPLVIQRESARKRLGWWADHEAEQREAGWRILEPESAFGSDEWPFELVGMTIRGRIDRIEEHPELGIRVIDFKTFSPVRGNTRRAVDQYHLAPLKRTESPEDWPDWMLWEDEEGRMHRWIDLQLPLYLLAMNEREPNRDLVAAYAILGKAETEVGIDEWTDLGAPLLEAARNCAAGVIESVRAKRFWPPSDDAPPWDDFRELLAPTAEDAVDPSLLHAEAGE